MTAPAPPCDRCQREPGDVPWAGELLCWPCAGYQLGQVADDLRQPYGLPVHVAVRRG